MTDDYDLFNGEPLGPTEDEIAQWGVNKARRLLLMITAVWFAPECNPEDLDDLMEEAVDYLESTRG